MQKNLQQKVHDFIRERLRQKHWRRIIIVMACIVVFCTTYALILPAVTLTDKTYCGKEEHTHTQENCYERVLICDSEESQVSQDSQESQESESVSIHTHTDICYEEKPACSLEEHKHTLLCYSNPNADVESADVWERTFPQNLGDNWAENVVTVANSQIGYVESTANYTVQNDGVTIKGYTRYGEWYGDPYGDWNTYFASFCLNYAGVPKSAVPIYSDCDQWVKQLRSDGLYESAADCFPEPGFLVFFDTDNDGSADHVGIVTEADGEKIKTVEGDINNAVARNSYSQDSNAILGYCVLPENPNYTAMTADNFANAVQTADANDDTDSIAVCEKKTVFVSEGKITKISFVPEYTHSYVFYSEVSGDTYGYLYDAGEKKIASNDDGGNGANFKITSTLTGGATYYFGASWLRSNVSGDIIVYLELNDTHSYTENEQGEFVCTCGKIAPLSGTCGKDLTWNLDKETGTLSIVGTGAMTNYSESSQAPWAGIATLIKNVNISEGATSIGSSAFRNCSSLKNIELPDTLTNIGANAFNNCTALDEIDLSSTGMKTIEAYTFTGCKSLKSVLLPVSLTSLKSNAFNGCSSLTEINLSETAVKSIENNAFQDCTSLKKAILPQTLTSIGEYAFSGCSSMTNIDLSDTAVETIGDYAFSNCSSLTDIDLSETAVKSIRRYVFQYCTSLKTVVLPQILTTIEYNAFYNCKSLKDINLSDTAVTSIGGYAFNFCSSLENIALPNTLTNISSYAFTKCNALKTVSFSDNLTSIGSWAFANCNSLECVDLSNTKVSVIGDSSFYNCKTLKEILLPDTLTTLSKCAFAYCDLITSVDLSSTSITVINDEVFKNCKALKNVTFPKDLTTFGKEVFANCTAMTEFVIPENVTSVGNNAFVSCSSLKELRLESADVVFSTTQSSTAGRLHVTVADSVNNLCADTITALEKMGCVSITLQGPNYLTAGDWHADFLPERLNSLPQSEYFADAQGVIYRIDSETNTASVFYCPPGIESYNVLKELPTLNEKKSPIPVTGVDSLAFNDAANLTTLTFESPETITNLKDMAFYHAVMLKSINGQSTSQGVLNTFTSPSRTTGTMLFYHTKISGGEEVLTSDPIVLKKNNLTLTISVEKGTYRTPELSDDGTYLYYTGEAGKTTIVVSNPDSTSDEADTVVRVYFRFDENDGSITYNTGTYTVKSAAGNSYEMNVVKTEETGCYYVEMERPKKGDTISIIVESSYPSPSSDGGNAVIWGALLTAEEKAQVGTGLVSIDKYQALNWTTKPDTFPIKKSEISTGSSVLAGDGEGGAYITKLSFAISQSRSGTTLEGVGKDHMSSVDYEDVLTLPDGAALADDVKEAIQNGTIQISKTSASSAYGYKITTPGGKEILSINTGSNDYRNNIRNIEMFADDSGRLILRWSFDNTNLSTEIADLSFNCNFGSEVLFIKNPQSDKIYIVDNAVKGIQHFMYSEDQTQQDTCSVNVKTADSRLEINKTSVRHNSYFGSPCIYSITASNPGALPYEKLAFLEDNLPDGLYMRPEDMAAAFAEDTDHQLTVTIENATLCTTASGETVSGIDGSTGTLSAQNSGSGTNYSGKSNNDPDTTGYEASTITVTWGENNNFKIRVKDGEVYTCAPDEDSIRSILERIGLVVTKTTRYCQKWDLRNNDGSISPLVGGAKIRKLVYCTSKDTFMLLKNDTDNQYPSSSNWLTNYGSALGADEKIIKSSSYRLVYYREFNINKDWSLNGESIDSETKIRKGDILDYSLTVKHYGSGKYDALPFVDHMIGSQAILAPVSKNSGASWADKLETVIYNGVKYYVLNIPGTYNNVWTSDNQLADSITVTELSSGLDTIIKWYFVEYEGARTDTIRYHSYVCPSENALSFSIGNECWLNDHESHRLYDTLPGWTGTVFDFDKKIVDSVGDTGAGTDYSVIHEGETVVYRLTLTGPTDIDGNNLPMTITGRDMYDALPSSMDGYRWNSENVRITYMDNYTVTNKDSWSITEPEESDGQYIRWADDFTLSFTGKAHIYVELDFPSDTLWQEYSSKYGAEKLENSFYVLSVKRSVTHEVSIPAHVYLQKGVYENGYVYGESNSYSSDMNSTDDRMYYQNNDVKRRAIKYYVSLYNEGPSNLYLTDMQDVLPRGFTAYSVRAVYDLRNITVKRDDGSKASTVSANIAITKSICDDGRQLLKFSFSQISSTSTTNVSYDNERGLCYLKPGEAIVFTYICLTNDAADTDDSALNTVTMPYYDFNGGGVVIDNQCSVTAPDTNKYTPNDGGCELLSNGQAESLGVSGSTKDTQWLKSDVTVIRGEIKPGITKTLTSKTTRGGATTNNPVSAVPTDTLNWSITTDNDGTNSIIDYVLTDSMQSPYMFTGNVSYNIYNDQSNSNLVGYPNSLQYLFTISPGSDDNHLSIKQNKDNTIKQLEIGGEEISLTCRWVYSANYGKNSISKDVIVKISIAEDKDGNVVMSLRFPDAAMAIPEGGRSVLTLSTENPSNTLENKQFVNVSYITPMTQSWDDTTNKGNVTTLLTPYSDEKLSTVRNSAPITVSYGYVTGSSKRITEIDNAENTALCTDEKNYIVLENANKLFSYTLSVNNSTPKAMDKFILIDGLPQTDDHTSFIISDSRFSEFKVSLADDPDFIVTVTNENGTVTTLDAENYTVEFSDKTDFSDYDWNGTSEWSSSTDNARSVRLKILDSTGVLIPSGSTVSLTFTCKIDDPNVKPGQVAWNSFGYHYRLLGEAAEPEAAPLKVGVKIPSVPEIRKKITDHAGLARTVDKDETFSFLVYPGTALNGDYLTREDWITALGDTPYEEFTVTVKSGESISEAVRSETTKWVWTEGAQYTFVELPCSEEFSFRRFIGAASKTYTLTYTSGQIQTITCENTALRWSINITKENISHESLRGAIFALYSPNAEEQLTEIPIGYSSLNIGMTTEYKDKTWYLTAVQTTPDDGKLSWENLLADRYYLLEIKAPDGYYLNSPAGQILKQEKETQGSYSVTILNYAGYSLPKTGGTGILPYAISGLLLAGGFLCGSMLWRKRERRSN